LGAHILISRSAGGVIVRQLSPTFMQALKLGFLAGITGKVIHDFDLDLQIRNNYLNLYYKGNSLLKLAESAPARYQVDIHQKFAQGLDIPSELVDPDTTSQFLQAIPRIKQNIIEHGKGLTGNRVRTNDYSRQ
jgi:predicted component of type VI protein secretion system